MTEDGSLRVRIRSRLALGLVRVRVTRRPGPSLAPTLTAATLALNAIVGKVGIDPSVHSVDFVRDLEHKATTGHSAHHSTTTRLTTLHITLHTTLVTTSLAMLVTTVLAALCRVNCRNCTSMHARVGPRPYIYTYMYV